VNVTARTKKYTYLGEHKEGRICYIVRIKRGPCPFRLKRKVERWKPSRRNDAFRFIDRIEQVAEEKSVCIEVDSPEGLYVTSDYIVTHNSSVLDSISMTLGGKREVCERPLRDGTQAGYSVVEIGDGDGPLPEDLIAQRTYGPGGAETIIVQARDGRKHSTPQKVLDRLVGTLAFDPVGFLRLSGKEQAAMLRELLGVDTADLDAQYKAIYDKRTDANRDAKSWATRVDAMPRHLDAPEAEVPAREVLEQIDDARAINQKSHDTRARHQRAIEEEGRLQRMVEEAQRQLEKATADRALLDDLVLTLEDIDEAPLRAALDQCEEVNAKVRANAQRTAALKQLTAISDEAARLTDLLTKIEGERAARLAAAPNPLPGLALTDGRVVYQGVPLEQCSSAEQLRVAVALGLAQNPKLKVLLVRDGSLLDPENLALLGELAAAHDAQVWVEVVGEREGCAVVIEDGTVKEMAVAPSKEASDV
jgi:hypothetical protein